jgi:hypothetical protein
MLAHIAPVTVAVDPDLMTTAVAVLVGGLGTLAIVTMLADRSGLLPKAAVPFGRWVAMVVAGLSVGAASIHFAVIGAHFEEYPPYGVAFVALAWFQVGWAVAYLQAPRRRLAIAAIVVNAGALAAWLVSRTVGLPIGPEDGHVEPVGPLDIAAVLMEVALIAVLAWDLGAIGRKIRPALPRAGAVMAIGSSALVVVLLTTTAFVAAGGDAHGGPGDELPPIGAIDTPSGSPAPIATATAVPEASSPNPSVSPSSAAPPAVPSLSTSPSPVNVAPSVSIEPTSTASAPPASRTPPPTPERSTPTQAPAILGPTQRPTATPPTTTPGAIRFGTSIGQDGEIVMPATEFGEGQTAVWVADFIRPANAATVRMFIIQVLPDGREFEHWREDIPVDPDARRLVGRADLSIYLHGGDGRHVMRYVGGDTLLAEGAFELVR